MKSRMLRGLGGLLVALAFVALVAPLGTHAAHRQASPEATPSALPGTPVGEQLAWVIMVVNEQGGVFTDEDVQTRFAPELLDEVPIEILSGPSQQLAAAFAPTVAVAGFTRPPTATQANALLATALPVVVAISVEAAPLHRITGLSFALTPAPPGVELGPVVDLNGTLVGSPERIDGLFDIGGRRLYLSCIGSGGPTVVLEAALGDPASFWFAVEQAVAPFTRVCSYDRANTVGGASDPTPTPRTAANVVADLHALLEVAAVPGPYVLVGHSDGGLFARLYAHTHPDEVAGLVLVDAAHEEQEARLEALMGPELWARFEQLFAEGPNPEGLDFGVISAEVREARATGPLPSMPLVVVSAGLEADPSQYPPDWPVEADQALDREQQADLAGLAPNGRQIVAERSGHYVHQTEPEVVVEAIRQVVEAVRDPNSWATPVAATPIP